MSLSATQLRLVQIMVDRGCKIDMTPERIVSGTPSKSSYEIRTAVEKQAWMVDQGIAQVIKALDHDPKGSVAVFIETLKGVSVAFARSSLKGHTFGRHGWVSDDASDATVRRAVKELVGILEGLPPEGAPWACPACGVSDAREENGAMRCVCGVDTPLEDA